MMKMMEKVTEGAGIAVIADLTPNSTIVNNWSGRSFSISSLSNHFQDLARQGLLPSIPEDGGVETVDMGEIVELVELIVILEMVELLLER